MGEFKEIVFYDKRIININCEVLESRYFIIIVILIR